MIAGLVGTGKPMGGSQGEESHQYWWRTDLSKGKSLMILRLDLAM